LQVPAFSGTEWQLHFDMSALPVIFQKLILASHSYPSQLLTLWVPLGSFWQFGAGFGMGTIALQDVGWSTDAALHLVILPPEASIVPSVTLAATHCAPEKHDTVAYAPQVLSIRAITVAPIFVRDIFMFVFSHWYYL
jgi:hypothetical protein